jgi:hypothetical protein
MTYYDVEQLPAFCGFSAVYSKVMYTKSFFSRTVLLNACVLFNSVAVSTSLLGTTCVRVGTTNAFIDTLCEMGFHSAVSEPIKNV